MRRTFAVLMLLLLASCGAPPDMESAPVQSAPAAPQEIPQVPNQAAAELPVDAPGSAPSFKLSSPAFLENSMIPEKYTCHGDNINPPLEISGIPPGTKSLVLVMDDPDAPKGTFTHWLMWNIPPVTTSIPEDSVPGMQGTTTARKQSYTGPCPPSGTHRYLFLLYAVDTTLDLPDTASKAELQDAIRGHDLGRAIFVAKYGG